MKTWLKENRKTLVFTGCTVVAIGALSLMNLKSDIAVVAGVIMLIAVVIITFKHSKTP